MLLSRFRPLALAICALAPFAFSPNRTFAASEALPNFHTVAPGIYRGGAPTDDGLRKLKAMGVKTIVDLRIAPKTVKKEGQEARAMGFNWINLPMGAEAPTTKEVKTMMATFQSASPQNPVYVHCQHGADRTGCMVGVYRVTHDHWTYDQAFKEMRKYGFNPRWVNLSNTVRRHAASQK
jgi:protein tyrosine/serine phosphatase